MRKKLLSTMLALCVMLTALPMGVSATGEMPETNKPTAIEEKPEESESTTTTPSADEPQISDNNLPNTDTTPTTKQRSTAEAVPLAENAPTSGTCGENLTWKLENRMLSISGEGDMDDYYNHSPAWRNSTIDRIVISNGVTSIGAYAFSGCSGLTSIEIPSNVTSIGDEAFRGCSSLTSIEIPSNVTSIGRDVLCCCPSLTNIKVGIGNAKYDSRGNCDAIIETSSNTLLYGCKNTKIPSSVTSIESYAFWGCSSLTNIEIPSSVTSIGESAFMSCDSLTSIEIPSSITSIENWAFGGCSSLTNITIPSNVTSIKYSVFSGCSSLRSVTIPSSVTSIEAYAFQGCSSLRSITIPSSITSIGEGVFRDCNSLTSITIPSNIISIGYGAFRDCSSLRNITIPKSVKEIGAYAFTDCHKLTDVYYGGSEEDWQAIKIGQYNEILKSSQVTITYNGATKNDILTFKGVEYYDTIAKASVNVDLTWNWNDLLKGDPYYYKINLAKMGVALSASIEGKESSEEVCKILYGTDKERRLMCDAVTYIGSTSPDMAAGIKTMETDGETKHIIFIVLRGTTTTWDEINDMLSHFQITHWGINPVSAELDSCLKEWEDTYGKIDRNNTKFFVTGHSLGGACANLLAANLSEKYGEENVFGYTFAAPSPLDKKEDISRFRGNIYNFLCNQDHVPSHFGYRRTWYGYGYPRWFNMCELPRTADIYSTITEGKQWLDTYAENNKGRFAVALHAPSIYMAYLMSNPNLKDSTVNYNYVRIKCPVDVEVYNSNNELVGRIANDEIDYSRYSPDVSLIVCDGAKYVYFLNNDTYTIELTGTGDGIMTYTAASKDINTDIDKETKVYSNVKINAGKKFRSVVSSYGETNTNNLVEIPDVELLVTDDNGNAIAQVLPDTEASSLGKDNGTEIPIKNNGGSNTKPGGNISGSKPGINIEPDKNTSDNKPEFKPDNNSSTGNNVDNATDKNSPKKDNAKNTAPKTADIAPILSYVWLIIISGLSILFWCFISRRKGEKNAQ